MYWDDDAVHFFANSMWKNAIFGYMPISNWMYIAMGTNRAGSTFAVLRLRSGHIAQSTLSTNTALTPNSVFQGSNNAVTFTVRGYTGLFSGRKTYD
jgi:hypothetical protein